MNSLVEDAMLLIKIMAFTMQIENCDVHTMIMSWSFGLGRFPAFLLAIFLVLK